MEALGINLGYFFVQLLNFLVIFVVLRVWVYKPLIQMLQDRREAIAQGLEDARVAAEARANAESDAEKILADAQGKASEVVREATTRAEEAAKDIKAAADKVASEARKTALAEVEKERDAMLGELRGQVAALAMAATQKLIGEALDDKRQRSLIDEFFSGIKGGKVEIAKGATGDSVVTSALPLTDKEKKDVAKALSGEVEFKVDPSILGGLVVRMGDKVMDGSVAGKLDTMRQNLR
ncbi:MAG: F0F1 ATP synthase subunit B [Anaerolineae bacterium]|nr:F0F1 ATP synthase subunit B [Anaerolineae bacterium]